MRGSEPSAIAPNAASTAKKDHGIGKSCVPRVSMSATAPSTRTVSSASASSARVVMRTPPLLQRSTSRSKAPHMSCQKREELKLYETPRETPSVMTRTAAGGMNAGKLSPERWTRRPCDTAIRRGKIR
eukprot:scaffold47246_cov81-Phaeocystis_antarctica.AAC.4